MDGRRWFTAAEWSDPAFREKLIAEFKSKHPELLRCHRRRRKQKEKSSWVGQGRKNLSLSFEQIGAGLECVGSFLSGKESTQK